MTQTPKKEVTETQTPKKEVKAFFISRLHAGLTLQVQKMVKKQDGTEVQELAEEARFTQFYDTYKGDTVRVGLLVTESPKLIALARSDSNVQEISEKDYKEMTDAESKHRLDLAPVPAT